MLRLLYSALVALAISVIPARSAEWQQAAVTIVSPFAAGGTADLLSRILAENMQAAFAQSVIVENKVGTGGAIGAAYVAKAKPDGYTLLVGSVATHAINQFVYPQLPFNPETDFEPISLIAVLPNLLVVSRSIPVKSVPELIDYLKANPGKLTYGSAGSGTSQHLAGELFKRLTGATMTHVPYKGAGEIMAALAGDQISLSFNNMTNAWPMAKAGEVRPLAVTSLKRNPTAPGVPTVAETIPGFEATSWFGLYAPKGTPQPVIDKLVGFVKVTLQKPEIMERLQVIGSIASPLPPAEFGPFMTAERKKWAEIVKAAGIKAN